MCHGTDIATDIATVIDIASEIVVVAIVEPAGFDSRLVQKAYG